MKNLQQEIKKFNDARGWSEFGQLKDLLLNMSEEIGEVWNVIKWLKEEEQKKAIKKNKDEVEDFVGDMLYLILKISYITDVDPEKAISDVMAEYEKRMPLEKTKGTHTNVKAGGYDKKYE